MSVPTLAPPPPPDEAADGASPGEASAPAPPGLAPAACANCGAERLGDYCQSCGQHYLDGRLTIRRLWREFASRVFNLNRGLLATFVGLIRRPGHVAADYVGGKRRCYTNPLSYLLLASAFSLLMLQFSEGALEAQMDAQFAEQRAEREAERAAEEAASTGIPHDHDGDGVADHEAHGPSDPAVERFEARMDEIFDGGTSAELFEMYMEGMTRFNSILTVFLCIPLVLLLRLLFGPARNVAEISVFSLYVVAQATVLASLVMPVMVRLGQTASMLMVLVYIGLAAWAAVQFWGEGFSAAWRAAVAMVVSYAVYFVVVSAFALVYIFDTVLSETGLSWGAFLSRLLS
jgi:hypothetical protein